MALNEYQRKRNFSETPEPKGGVVQKKGPLTFVVQLHHASRIHYDFRLEAEGVLKSWAVPKGPSLDPQEQRLAVQVEDHPLEYGSFEGIIPKGNYGAGTVMLWDEGTYLERGSKTPEESQLAIQKGLERGHLTFLLEGQKLQGEFALIRLHQGDQKNWLLVKKRDSFASRMDVLQYDRSVKTGRSIEEIRDEAPARGELWLPKRPLQENARSHAIPPPGIPSELEKGVSERKPSPEKIPRRNKPMLATQYSHCFDQKGWIFEIDRGGYRAIVEIENGSVHIYSKQLLSFNQKFPDIVKALRTWRVTAILDGEIVQKGECTVYWIRDLLHLNGESLRSLPLIERKDKLGQLIFFDEKVRFSPHWVEKGSEALSQATEGGFKGVLARNAYSVYHSGTSKEWLSIPVTQAGGEKGGERNPRFTHLDKIYWPSEGISKGEMIDYYRKIAPYLLPHLVDRPQSLHRFPDGIQGQGFFQKDLTGHHPRWIQTEKIFSESSKKTIDYLICQNEETLLYMANLGCIEINPWLSRMGSLDHPDFVVIDLDPDTDSKTPNSFGEVIEVAQELHEILDTIHVPHGCKTSGATGIHFYLPLHGEYDYDAARAFVLEVCERLHRRFPKNTSLERTPSKRRGRIYLDCFQNARGQTVASIYSLRPRPDAPVSTPLKWEELRPGLSPEAFHLRNMLQRVQKLGDLWKPLLSQKVDIPASLSNLSKKFPISR